jgi:hypothetical protein
VFTKAADLESGLAAKSYGMTWVRVLDAQQIPTAIMFATQVLMHHPNCRRRNAGCGGLAQDRKSWSASNARQRFLRIDKASRRMCQGKVGQDIWWGER